MSTVIHSLPSPSPITKPTRGHETILVYGDEPMWVTTWDLLLEKAGYEVFSTTQFASALVALVNERINVLLLCQSFNEVERGSIIETARAIKPEIKSVIFECDGRELMLDGRATFENIDGSGTLVNSIGRIILQND